MRYRAWLAAAAFVWIATPAQAADMAQCGTWLQEDLKHLEENATPGSLFKKQATERVFQAFTQCREGNLDSRADYNAWLKAQMATMDDEMKTPMPVELAQCDAWFYEGVDRIERDLLQSSIRKSEARVMLIDAYKRCSAGDLKSREAYEEWLRDHLFDIVFERYDGN